MRTCFDMKILHYSFGLPPYSSGGLPLYVKDLAYSQKRNGHEVNILIPKLCFTKHNRIVKRNGIIYLESCLPVSSVFGMRNPSDYIQKFDRSLIRNFFDQLKPDIFHIHSFMGLPKEFLEIAKESKIKIVYTTHDYYGICLKCNLIDSSNNFCDEFNVKKCAKCNQINGLNKQVAYLINNDFYKKIKNNAFIYMFKSKYRSNNVGKGKQINFDNVICTEKKIGEYEKLLNYYYDMFHMIDIFHFNSEISQEIYKRFIPDIVGKVAPITLEHIKDNRSANHKDSHQKIVIGFIGRKEPYKGLNILLHSLKKLVGNYVCYLYGDNFSEYENEYVINKGIYSSSELSNIFHTIDVLVVPSICKETFGFVALEAASYGVPVLMSKNVGSQCIFENKNDIVFDANVASLVEILQKFINESGDKFYPKVNKNIFNIDYHSESIIRLYSTKGDVL